MPGLERGQLTDLHLGPHRHPGCRQVTASLQIGVNGARGAAAFVDRPDNQALSAATVTRSEDTFDAGRELSVQRLPASERCYCPEVNQGGIRAGSS